jgi:ornithine cyclodeaminase/alanine dehydrogenase-like protein (mu-crystallin family)
MSVQMVDAARLRALVGIEDLIEPVSRAFQDFSAGLAQAATVIMYPGSDPALDVRGEWLRTGQHIMAVGANDNTKCELDARCLQRANRLIVDSRESAKDHGEVHRWLKQGALKIEDIHGELGEVLAGRVPGRRSSEEITIAKCSSGLAYKLWPLPKYPSIN